MNGPIRAVDLFCGAGGLTHGLALGGIDVAVGIDLDPTCRYPFETNNSAVFVERDVAEVGAAEIGSFLQGGQFSLLAGCAPCQPYSTYSRSGRNREYEKQWPLVSEFARLVREVEPDLITMENVPQLSGHPVFLQLLQSLSAYKTWWSVVECSLLGVPQTRKRLVLLASKLGRAPALLAQQQVQAASVRQVIGGLPHLSAGARDPHDPLHVAPALSSINLERIRASRPGGSWRDWPQHLLAECHRRKAGETYPSVYGRMEWDRPAPTITTQCFGYGNGRFGHPEQDRAISLREAALLQTFPATYEFVPPGDTAKFNNLGRLIGNAVPVKLGEVIGRALVAHAQRYGTPTSIPIASRSANTLGSPELSSRDKLRA